MGTSIREAIGEVHFYPNILYPTSKTTFLQVKEDFINQIET
jgi:hypothetical protein